MNGENEQPSELETPNSTPSGAEDDGETKFVISETVADGLGSAIEELLAAPVRTGRRQVKPPPSQRQLEWELLEYHAVTHARALVAQGADPQAAATEAAIVYQVDRSKILRLVTAAIQGFHEAQEHIRKSKALRMALKAKGAKIDEDEE